MSAATMSGDEGGLTQKTPRGGLMIANLPSLQNLIKRSPDAYSEEFHAQWTRFLSLLNIIQSGLGRTKKDEDSFRELVGFISQVANMYSETTAKLPDLLSELLLSSVNVKSEHGARMSDLQLSPDTRRALISALVLMRRRGAMSEEALLKTLFPMLSISNGASRQIILDTIVGDIKKANLKGTNHRLNRMVQAYLFDILAQDTGVEATGPQVKGNDNANDGVRKALWAVKIAIDLWRKNVWRDGRAAELIARSCTHKDTKVQSIGLHFFLTLPNEMDEEDSDDEETPDIRQVKHRQQINKKNRASERKAKADIRKAVKAQQKREAGPEVAGEDASPIYVLQDPHSLGSQLYTLLKQNDRRYTLDHKVLIMRLLGRLMGIHELFELDFYSYIMRFLTPKQLDITRILVALAESVHGLIPPEDLAPVIRKIAYDFVHQGVAPEVNAAGLNAIREVCRRQPLAMEADLLQDLVEYRKSKHKGVMMASRSLLALYREVNPSLLQRRDRGKHASMTKASAPVYGEASQGAAGLAGLELLQDRLGSEAEGWSYLDQDSDDSDVSGEWHNVSEDGDDIDISSDDEEQNPDDSGQEQIEEEDADDISDEGSDGFIDVASDASEDSDDGFINVDSDDDGSESSASDPKSDRDTDAPEESAEDIISKIASERIMTPADFAMLNEVRIREAQRDVERGGGKAAKRKLEALKESARRNADNQDDRILDEDEILGPTKRAKSTHEERLASIQAGREGREKFGSSMHKRLGQKAHSTTNEEKRRKKAFNMVAQSHRVRGKKGASLAEKSKNLRTHITRQKNRGRRRLH